MTGVFFVWQFAKGSDASKKIKEHSSYQSEAKGPPTSIVSQRLRPTRAVLHSRTPEAAFSINMASDTIIPVPVIETSHTVMVLACLVISGRLDTRILRDSLAELVSIWPILGSRLSRNTEGQLQYHQPAEFHAGRPAFILTIEEHDGAYPDMPSRTSECTPQPSFEKYVHYFRSSNSPRTLKALLKLKDAPIMHVHISCFEESTCIGFAIPHVVSDALGLGTILSGWTSVICGRRSAVPDLYVGDVLEGFGKPYPSTKEGVEELRESVYSGLRIWSLWEKLKFVWNFVPQFIFHPQERSQIVFIPLSTVERLRENAMVELAEATGNHGAWVSENDIVTAVMVKINNLNQDPSDVKPFRILFAANMRGKIPELPSNSPFAWIHNAIVAYGSKPFPTGIFSTLSVAEIAMKIREAIIAHKTVDQNEKLYTIHRETARRKAFPLMTLPDGKFYFVTSWVASSWNKLDFSAAALFEDRPDSKANAGRVIFSGGSVNALTRVSGVIMGKAERNDFGGGGYWCEMAARPIAWSKMEEYLASL